MQQLEQVEMDIITFSRMCHCWPDPTALGALMEMKGEASAALGAKTAAGAQGALQGSATSLNCCYFS